MKCKRCTGPAVVEIRRHRAAFCPDCFAHHCREQVRRAVEGHRMFTADEPVLVAVSGGKDSLALWDLLLDLGYEADGVYLGLGIGEYSTRSREFTEAFAARRGARLHVVDLPTDVGFSVPGAARTTRRPPCGACGLSKRHLLNTVALEHGYPVLATGHNLDDEAAVLYGNVLNWNLPYLARQRPVLPGRPGFARRVKPLVRMGEYETAAYCVLRGIDYIVEECPMAVGNRHLRYKESLNALEERSPGTKAAFYTQFVEHMLPLVEHVAERERESLGACRECGSPSTAELCAFCRLSAQAAGAVDVEVRLPAKGRRRRAG